MYRFLINGSLLAQMYVVIRVLQKNNVYPVFIFDGKPPDMKNEVLTNRRKIRDNAIIQLATQKYTTTTSFNNAKENELLRKQSLRITKEQIVQVKLLMDACNVLYIDAPAEADTLCSQITKENLVYATLSDDSDLHIYDCPRVLKNISIMKETFDLYEEAKILNELSLTKNQFIDMCVLAGTDYNPSNRINIEDAYGQIRQREEDYVEDILVKQMFQYNKKTTRLIKMHYSSLFDKELYNRPNLQLAKDILEQYGNFI
jgi:flap endonuclease-1